MNADGIAPLYRSIEYAAFGRALERARFCYLPRLATANRILILGEGDGRFLARLLELNASAEIHVVDLSFEMLRVARARVRACGRVHFVQASALALPLQERAYDAIVTNFFLDCLTAAQAAALIAKLAKALRPGGQWLITEFHVPESGWRRLHATLWISVMYRFFQLATALEAREIPVFDEPLANAGLERIAVNRTRFGLISSELWRIR